MEGESQVPHNATVKKIISGYNFLALTLYLQLEMYKNLWLYSTKRYAADLSEQYIYQCVLPLQCMVLISLNKE